MALYTCDDSSCFLYQKGQSFADGFSCPRTMLVSELDSGTRCGARELTVIDTAPSRSLSSGAASWGLGRGSTDRDDETREPPPRPAPPPAPPRSLSWALIVPLVLAPLILAGAGAYVFRQPLGAWIGLTESGGTVASAETGGALTEERLLAALLAAGYSRELSDKILSVRRQIDTIRQRNEASTPELLQQLAEVEAKIVQNEAERRAAFQHYMRSVEALGKQPAGDVADALERLDKRLDQASLVRLKALLPVVREQVAEARAGKIDHDRWIGQIEVAPI